MSSQNSVNLQSIAGLFEDAVQNNEVSQDAASVMIGSLNDTNILGCTGVDVNDIDTDIVTLISLVIDSSYSMKQNEQAVRDAYDDLLIKAMRDSKQADSMLISARTFDEKETVLYEFKKVNDIGKIGSQYVADGGATILYEAAINAMTAIRAYAKKLNDSGVQTKCIVVVFSDGANNYGKYMKPDPVKKVAEDCIRSEMFYLTYVGFKQDINDNLDAIGKSMGFTNILTTSSNPSEVRRAIGLVSQSAIRKSQTAIGPSNSFFQ